MSGVSLEPFNEQLRAMEPPAAAQRAYETFAALGIT
jgi:hypothetical protein